MFPNNQNYDQLSEKELLIRALGELDEIKRYVANVYSNTDNEISEIREGIKKVERKLDETDSQVDKIEQFQRILDEMKSSLRNIEKKV